MRSQVMYIKSYLYIPVNYYNITVLREKKEKIMNNVGTDSYSGLKYVN